MAATLWLDIYFWFSTNNTWYQQRSMEFSKLPNIPSRHPPLSLIKEVDQGL